MSAKKKHRAFTNASRQWSQPGRDAFWRPVGEKKNFDPDQLKSVDKDVKLNIQMVTK